MVPLEELRMLVIAFDVKSQNVLEQRSFLTEFISSANICWEFGLVMGHWPNGLNCIQSTSLKFSRASIRLPWVSRPLDRKFEKKSESSTDYQIDHLKF